MAEVILISTSEEVMAGAVTKYIHVAVCIIINGLYWILAIPYVDAQKSVTLTTVTVTLMFLLLFWLIAVLCYTFPDWMPKNGFDFWDDDF